MCQPVSAIADDLCAQLGGQWAVHPDAQLEVRRALVRQQLAFRAHIQKQSALERALQQRLAQLQVGAGPPGLRLCPAQPRPAAAAGGPASVRPPVLAAHARPPRPARRPLPPLTTTTAAAVACSPPARTSSGA
jgi:hypothetical protein